MVVGHSSMGKTATLARFLQERQLLRESLDQERSTLDAYYELLKIAEGNSVALEEYAREMILLEEMHLDEVNKMLRKPGEIEPFSE